MTRRPTRPSIAARSFFFDDLNKVSTYSKKCTQPLVEVCTQRVGQKNVTSRYLKSDQSYKNLCHSDNASFSKIFVRFMATKKELQNESSEKKFTVS